MRELRRSSPTAAPENSSGAAAALNSDFSLLPAAVFMRMAAIGVVYTAIVP
jgi:hypothetical protein